MARGLTTEEFIQKSVSIHGAKYCYDNVAYSSYYQEVTINCPIHGNFLQKPANHLAGKGCKECAKKVISKKRTSNWTDILKEFNKVHNNKYDYSLSVYENCDKKIKIICPIHGQFKQSPYSHKKGHGCKKCADGKSKIKKDGRISDLIDVHGQKYDYSITSYIGFNEKIGVICPDHGRFEIIYNNHLAGKGCRKCATESTKNKLLNDWESVKKAFLGAHSDIYDYSKSIYLGTNRKLEIICSQHGSFFQTPKAHINGQGCPKCGRLKAAESHTLTNEEFIDKSKQIHGDKYSYDKTNYKKARQKVEIECSEHGTFEQTASSHLIGSGCPSCGIHKSQIEEFIKDFFHKYDIPYSKNNREIIKPYELDFYCFEKSIAIECHGIHWHSELMGKDRNYHLNKLKLCQESNTRLVQLFENEIINKPKIVMARLKTIFGKQSRSIYGRKCKIKEVAPKIKSNFLNKYHVQGNDRSSINLGLFYKHRLVAVMTFCKNRKALGKEHKDGEFELSRYATIANFCIVGGASKLLKHFERNYSPSKLTTYADLRWSEGNMYFKLGFEKIGQSNPNYWYFHKRNRMKLYHRFNFRKQELNKKLESFDPGLTEWQNMMANSWNRIWDCGNLVFQKTYDS